MPLYENGYTAISHIKQAHVEACFASKLHSRHRPRANVHHRDSLLIEFMSNRRQLAYILVVPRLGWKVIHHHYHTWEIASSSGIKKTLEIFHSFRPALLPIKSLYTDIIPLLLFALHFAVAQEPVSTASFTTAGTSNSQGD